MRDKNLYNLFQNFVFEIYPLLDPALEKTDLKPKYENYPYLKYKDNGMPDISLSKLHSPYKIRDLFDDKGQASFIDLRKYISFADLHDYLQTHKGYRACISRNITDKYNLYRSLSMLLILNVIERYYLLNTSKTKNEELLLNIYMPIEHYIYEDSLGFDISIPILFIHFDIDEYKINENTYIRRIPDDYQRARFNIKSHSPPIAKSLIQNSTHEVIFKNYHEQTSQKLASSDLPDEKADSIERFEIFFNALKIVTNNNSGFAQILAYPIDWADRYYLDLPMVQGFSLRKYPNHFDNYYWNSREFPQINNEELDRIAKIFNILSNNKNNKIKISNRRLRSSYLRDNEEDSILDIIIALETLLSDNEKGEIIHKLALRTAKLISMFNEKHNALQVFNAIKKIYDFRSAVVHGSSKINSKKQIKLHQESEPINTISLANDYLREIIGILLENPIYLDSKEIDKLLLQ